MKLAVIRARCAPELKARVAAFSERFGLDESDVVRQAVLAYLAKNESAATPGLAEASPPFRADPTPQPSADQVHTATAALAQAAVKYSKRKPAKKPAAPEP